MKHELLALSKKEFKNAQTIVDEGKKTFTTTPPFNANNREVDQNVHKNEHFQPNNVSASSNLFTTGENSSHTIPPRATIPPAVSSKSASTEQGKLAPNSVSDEQVKSKIFNAEKFIKPISSSQVNYAAFIASVLPIYQRIITGIYGIYGESAIDSPLLTSKHQAKRISSSIRLDNNSVASGGLQTTPNMRNSGSRANPNITVSSFPSIDRGQGNLSHYATPHSIRNYGNTAGTRLQASTAEPNANSTIRNSGRINTMGTQLPGPLRQFLFNLDEFITSVSRNNVHFYFLLLFCHIYCLHIILMIAVSRLALGN